MVKTYSLKSISTIDEETKAKIIEAGVPWDLYEKGHTKLGPVNKSSIMKAANMISRITENNFPLYPSLFSEMVVGICNEKSKQDFREIIDGKPGAGKSYSALYGAGRYAIEAAERYGQNPKDYFTLDNCALLQDTEGVTYLLDGLDKHQAVVIDDAGVSAGHKDFATKSNKNLDAIMATCRTKRWYVIFTAPMNKHLDLTIRELMYCRGKIYKSCHDAGFNIVQQQGISYKRIKHGWDEINPHYVYDEQRVEMYAYFSPDILDPYPHIIEQYDKARDAAADSLIHDKAMEEKERNNPTDKRAAKFDAVMKQHRETVYAMTHDPAGKWLDRKSVDSRGGNTYSVNKIMSETGLNDRQVNKIIAILKQEGK